MSDAQIEIFKNGSAWVRADFHLHTRKDKEFSFPGDDEGFVLSYIKGLGQAGIKAGVITNHNKFDNEEFKLLKKAARKKGIFLLPGVELSVNDGSNGIHTLIVFSNEWLEGGQDYINQFLNVAFEGKTPAEFENENGMSALGLIETIKKLENYHRDFFLVFAHVEERCGLWHALDGGRILEFGKNELFRNRTLAFQKVRTHDIPDRKCRQKVKVWLADWYPAEVEGSDCKSIDQIGQGQKCFIKIGCFSFEAVKYALLDHHTRVSSDPKTHERSFILNVSYEGGVLDGKTIHFSPELNVLIGTRGSGKSSILEAIRYALDIPFGEKTQDREYKKDLVGHALGSGGKVIVLAMDQRGQQYEIRRIYGEHPDAYINGVMHPGISIRDTIVHKPIYFGQKDLSSTGEGFEKDLVEKLVGENLFSIREQIEIQRDKVTESVERLKQLSRSEDKIREYQAIKQDAEIKLEFYRKYGVEEKLQKVVDFDADSRKCSKIISIAETYLTEMESFISTHEDELLNQRIYSSRENAAFFTDFFEIFDRLLSTLTKIKEALSEGQAVLPELRMKENELEALRMSSKDEFAEIERKLEAELKDMGAKFILPGEFRELQKRIEQSKQMLEALEKQESQRTVINLELLRELTILNDLWHEEYKAIQNELDKVNQNRSSLEIKPEFKGDRNAFIGFMKDMFRGSRIRETTFTSLAGEFTDFAYIYRDLQKAKETIGGSAHIFEEYFNENLAAFLTWQVPNRFIIEYRGKELKHHSLGQRASALILFVLSQRENDVIIIDQPEDDLDNQTIYEDVIKLIRSLKPDTQFIFATHNANFPVLGDAEQIISCSYSDDSIDTKIGSIDNPEIQKEIVDIMEGGEEAFKQRKRIYEIWKPRNS